jgi:hypothetical protein
MRPIQPPVQRTSEALSSGIKCPWREFDHWPPRSNEMQRGACVNITWCLDERRDKRT